MIQEFLHTIDPEAGAGRKGRAMMRQRLRDYLRWRGRLGAPNFRKNVAGANSEVGRNGKEKEREREDNVSEALKKKDRERAERAASRRRVRGGAPSRGGAGERNVGGASGSAGGNGEKEVIDVDKLDMMPLYALSFTSLIYPHLASHKTGLRKTT